MTLGLMIVCNLLATMISTASLLCIAIGIGFGFSPNGPLGYLSEGLFGFAVAVFIFGLTTPFWVRKL